MKLVLHSQSFFSSAIKQSLFPPAALSGATFANFADITKGRAPGCFLLAIQALSEIHTAGGLALVRRIGTLGAADEAMALFDDIIEVDGFATRARKSATPALNSATPALNSATPALNSATAALNSAMPARKSATAALNSAMPARMSATAARMSAMTARNSAIAARKSATTARKAATGALGVTTKAGSSVYTGGRRATLITAAAVRCGSEDFNDGPLVTRGD